MIDKIAIEVDANESGHHRGLHLVIMNPLNGVVEFAKVFDTYKTSKTMMKFLLNEIPKGYIIIAACQDECVTKLSYTIKKWFSKMGSKEVWNIKYR